MAGTGKRGRKAGPPKRRRPVAPRRSSLERFELALRALNEGVYDWDIARGTTYYSERVTAAVGLTAKELRTAADWHRRIHPEDRPRYDAALVEHFKGRTERFECDFRYRARDGSWRWARQHGIATRDARGRAVRMVGSTGNIDDLKRAELELHRAHAETAEALERQTATAEILRVISSSPGNVQPTFKAILESTTRLCDSNIAALFLYDGEVLTCAAHHNTTPAFARVLDAMRSPPSRETATRLAALERAVVRVDDYQHDPRFKLLPSHLREESRSLIAVPLLREGALVGVITTWRREVRPFADKHIELLKTFADQAVIAIENVRLFNETKEALEQQTATAQILAAISSSPGDTQPVLEAIAATAMHLFGVYEAGIVLQRNGHLELATSVGLDEAHLRALRSTFPRPLDLESGVNEVAVGGRIFHAPDLSAPQVPAYTRSTMRAAGLHAMLGVPLLREGKAIGGIFLSRVKAGAFSDKQIALVRSFADQAVIAIENARLFNETKEALEQQTATAEVLRVISGSPTDTRPVFDAIVRSCQRLFSGDSVALALVADGMVYPKAGVDERGAPLEVTRLPPWPLDHGSGTGAAVLDDRAINLSDLSQSVDAFPRMKDLAIRLGFQSGMWVPLRREGGVVGVLSVLRRATGAFTEPQIALAQTFADQAVIAIENVRLFNETKEALERQTATSEILSVISSTPADTQPVFDAIVRNAQRLISAKSAVLLLRRESDACVVAYSAPGLEAIPDDVRRVPLDRDRNYPSRVILDREVVHLPDWEAQDVIEFERSVAKAYGFGSGVQVPLLRKGEGIGALVVARATKGRFSDKETALLRSFADQAVIAIENVRLFRELQARNASLTEALEQQTATAEVLRVISASPTDVQPVFDIIGERAEKLCAAEVSVVSKVDGEHIRMAAIHGMTQEGIEAVRQNFPMRLDAETITARTVRDRAVVHVPDVLADPGYAAKGVARTAQYRSCLGVPMVREGLVIGVIFVARATPERFSDSQIGLLKTFADQAVIAIENVRLFNETREALERQTATAEILKVIASSPSDVKPVFQAIAESALRLVGGRSATVVQRVGDELRLAALTATGREGDEALKSMYPARLTGRRAVGKAVLSGLPVQAADLESDPSEEFRAMVRARGIRSILAVPMVRDGQGVGAINVSRAESGSFSDHHVGLLKTFADQAVIAIENVRLFNETREALERQTATAEILKVIASSQSDVQPVFEAIAERALNLCGARYSFVTSFDGELIHLKAFRGISRDADELIRSGYPVKPGSAAASARAIEARAPAEIRDVLADPRYSHKEMARMTGFRSALAVPMLREGEPVGTITIGHADPRTFPEKELRLLQTFADQAVIAIENVRLFNGTREALERQTATAEVLKVIASSPSDVQPVLDTVAERAAHLCDSTNVTVLLRQDEVLITRSTFSRETGTEPPRDHRVALDRTLTAGRAAVERRTVHVEDVVPLLDTEYPGARENQRRFGFRTVLAVPMLREGTAGGVIYAWRREVRPFTEHQIALLETFADQAVIAIENVRLFNETKEALARQTATADILKVIGSSLTDAKPVFEAIVRSCAELFGEGGVSLRLVKHGALEVQASHGYESDAALPIDRESAVGACVIEGKTIHLPDLEKGAEQYPRVRLLGLRRGFHSGIYTPLLREGQAIGSIAVLRRALGAFSDKEVALLQTFADQAVIAIENVRLFNETREALERQTATAEILRVIARSPDSVQPVFDAIVNSCLPLFGGMSVALFLKRGELIDRVAFALAPGSEDAARDVFPTRLDGGGINARAIQTGRLVQVADVMTEAWVTERTRAVARRMGFRSLMSAPLLRDGGAIGAIAVFRAEPSAFPAQQASLLETFADQAVIAIENVRLFNETREALEQQTAIGEVLKAISASPTDVAPVLDAVAVRAARICDASDARIFLVEGDRFRPVAGFGEVAVEGTPRPLTRGSPSGRAIIDRATQHIEDILALPQDEFPVGRPIAERTGWRTILSVPLMREDRAFGTIVLRRGEVRRFSEKQIALLKTFADQAAIAIENVRLFNQTKEGLERQTATAEILKVISESPTDTQPVFDAIVGACARIFPAHPVGINVVSEGGRIELRSSVGIDQEAVRRIFRDLGSQHAGGGLVLRREVAHFPDIEAPGVPAPVREGCRAGGLRAEVFAPMVVEGRGLGALWVGRATPGPFADKEIGLLKTFADQAAIAIQNVRLFNETKQALERQTATAEILKVIASSPSDVQPVFEAIVQSGLKLFADAAIGISIPDGDKLQTRALAGADPGRAKAWRDTFPIPLSREYMTGAAILDRKVVDVPDCRDAPPELERGAKNLEAMGYRALTVMPMMRADAAIGAIGVIRVAPGPLTAEQIGVLKTFADQAVIAVENVRLFKELKKRTKALKKSVTQLTALGEVGQAISSTLDLEQVLKAIVSRAVQLSGLDAGVIYEYDAQKDQFLLRASERFDESGVNEFRGATIRRGEGAVGRSVETREPAQVPDTHGPDYPAHLRELLDRSGFRALLAVPLVREEHIIGALMVIRRSPGAFPDETVELLKTFAGQSALAIQNARLFREIAEKGRQLEEASKHKSQFLASMSHELRTPLNAILGFNEMLLGQVYGEVPADMKEPLEDIQKSGRHLLRLINNVLDLAKIEAGRMELALADYSVQDTVESVRGTLRPLAESKGLELAATVPADIPLAYGDGGRITQCLMNLAGNSLKFTRSGRVEIGVELKDGRLLYRVADTGIGIPPEKIASLFTEFKQTDATIASEYGGTGLGLSITKKFIELHGGRIWVESEPGKGSQFLFEIPLRAQGAPA